jgi:hypothetical protein
MTFVKKQRLNPFVLKILQILVYVYFWEKKKKKDKLVIYFIILALVVESRSK